MCDKPFIVQRPLIQRNTQLSCNDPQDIFHLVREMQRILDIRPIFCVHKMQGDESGFILRQLHMQPLADQLDRILSQFVFLRIEPLYLPQKCIFKIDSLFIPVYRKIDMVRQSHIDTLIQF